MIGLPFLFLKMTLPHAENADIILAEVTTEVVQLSELLVRRRSFARTVTVYLPIDGNIGLPRKGDEPPEV